MENIKNLRIQAKNKEALELALNFNRTNISDESLIELLDEIIITSWYENKKNIGVNASLDIIKIYNNSLLELNNQQKNNIKFVLPESYELEMKNLTYFTTSSKNTHSDLIYINNLTKLDKISLPFVIFKTENMEVLHKLMNQKIKIKYFVHSVITDDYIICLTKKWKFENIVESNQGLNSWDV